MSFILKPKTLITALSIIAVILSGLIYTRSFWFPETKTIVHQHGSRQPLSEKLMVKQKENKKWSHLKPGSQVSIELAGPSTLQTNQNFRIKATVHQRRFGASHSYKWLIIKGAQTSGTQNIEGVLPDATNEFLLEQDFVATSNDVHIALVINAKVGEARFGGVGDFVVKPLDSRTATHFNSMGLQNTDKKTFMKDGKPIRVFQ